MSYQPISYQGLTEEQLRALPEEQMYGICSNLMDACNHQFQSMIEGIDSALKYCRAMKKASELSRSARKTIDIEVETLS